MRLSFIALVILSSTVAGRSHGHSSRGGTHSYPHSTGYSGYGSGGAQTSHSYPQSHGLSGNSNGANGRQTNYQQHNTATNYQQHNTGQYNYNSKTEVHHHYHYSPPQQISYGSTYHPVYQGHPPVYVYEYRDSGSRFDNLLTGLALYNLGRNSQNHHSSERQYSRTPGEICKLGINKPNGEYEETRIDCMLMSSFIWEDTTRTTQNEQHTVVKNTTKVTVTQSMNGNGNNNSNSSVTTVKSETVVEALKAKGPSIAVTPGMTCFMIRTYGYTTTVRKPVDCGLLQKYARSSLYRNGSQCLMPLVTILFNLIYLVIY